MSKLTYLTMVGKSSLDQTQTPVKERLMKNLAAIDIITVITQKPLQNCYNGEREDLISSEYTQILAMKHEINDDS